MRVLVYLWAILMTSGLVYATSTNAPITVTVVPPSGVACDFGSNTTLPTGTAGADLAASGNTHCVLNAVFTDNSGASVNGGPGCPAGSGCAWVMNNVNTYINQCAGAQDWGKFWFMWISGAGTGGDYPGPAPCRASIANDGSGTNVLTYQFAISDYVNGTSIYDSHYALALYWPLCSNSCASLRPALPHAMYEEVTYRLIAPSNQPGIVHGRDQATTMPGSPDQCRFGGNGCGMDIVMAEAGIPGDSVSMDNYGEFQAGPGCGFFNGTFYTKCTSGWQMASTETSYHTYASLATTDGTSTFNVCVYHDGEAYSIVNTTLATNFCTHYNQWYPKELLAHDRRLWEMVGDYENFPQPSTKLVGTIGIQIKSIRVFACTNYRGSGNDCPGPLVYH